LSKRSIAQRHFAVRGIFWRRALDWGAIHLPEFLHPLIIGLCAALFFLVAHRPRHALISNLGLALPGSNSVSNFFRGWLVVHHYAESLTDSALHRLRGREFSFELDGEEHLHALVASRNAIVLTAHIGNYDLGAAHFAARFSRTLHQVRAPEAADETREHLRQAVEAAPGMRVDFTSTEGLISFDLLGAIRRGEIVCIQGDRADRGLPTTTMEAFGKKIAVPAGPFQLACITETPIFPLFVTKVGPRRYRFSAFPPINCQRDGRNREAAIAGAAAQWGTVLQEAVRKFWPQWFAFAPLPLAK